MVNKPLIRPYFLGGGGSFGGGTLDSHDLSEELLAKKNATNTKLISTGIITKNPFWENQTMQMYGCF